MINLPELLGTWHIRYSSFPMWTKGNKKNPCFNYLPDPDHKNRIIDIVEYEKNGILKKIVGFDYPNTNKQSFTWRGKGLLYLLKSKWRIEYLSEDQEWMIISFKPTLFTPSGYDIVSKTKNPDSIQRETILKIFNERFVNVNITKII
jgi:hypothetical protein